MGTQIMGTWTQCCTHLSFVSLKTEILEILRFSHFQAITYFVLTFLWSSIGDNLGRTCLKLNQVSALKLTVSLVRDLKNKCNTSVIFTNARQIIIFP